MISAKFWNQLWLLGVLRGGRSICLLFFHKNCFFHKNRYFCKFSQNIILFSYFASLCKHFWRFARFIFWFVFRRVFYKCLWHARTIHGFLTRPLVGFSRWIAHCDPQGAGQSVGKVRFCLKISTGNDSGNDSKQISSYSTSVRITPTRFTLLI